MLMQTRVKRAVAISIAIGLLGGCAGGGRKPVASKPVPGKAHVEAMPQPPMGATVGMTIPDIGANGRRVTPNSNLSEAGAIWHLRMALNVAALSCLSQDAARVQYNAFLKDHKTALAKANKVVDAEYRAQYGAKGVDMRDRLNTRVYNFFALPPVQHGFCDQALSVGRTVNTKKSAELAGYAPQGLASLEAPFLAFYDAYAAYQQRLAAWRTSGAQLSSAR